MALLRAEPLSSESLRNIMESLPSESHPDRLAPLETRFHQQESISAEQTEETHEPMPIIFPSADSVFAEPLFLKEKARVGYLMQRMIKASKQGEEWKHYYNNVDELWAQSEKAREERTMATWKVEATTKALAQAEELLQRAKTVLENTDLNKTTLGRISSLTGKASDIFSKVPNEYAQVAAGFMGAISTGSGVANQLRAQAPVTIAEVTKMLADRTATQAEEIRKQANIAAPERHETAEQMEAQSRAQESTARKELIERLDPPVTNLSEKEWITWATLLVQAGKGNPIVLPLLAEHGLVDPLGAAEIIRGAWSEAEEEALYTEVKEKKLRIAPFEKDATQASAALKKANELVAAAEGVVTKLQERLTSALKIREHWKTELEEISGALDELEKRENRRKPGNDNEIKKKKNEFSEALSQFKEACNKLPSIEKELADASASLTAEEEKASLLSNQTKRAKETLQRNQERIVALQEGKKTTTRRTFRLPQLIERGEGTLSIQNLKAIPLSSPTASAVPVSSMFSQKKQKTLKIEPPFLLDKVYEIIGQSLLSAEERKNNVTATEATMERPSAARPGMIPEIRDPSSADIARWKALEKAKEYIEENEFLKATIKARLPQPGAGHEMAAQEPKLQRIQEEEDSSEEGSDLDEAIPSAKNRNDFLSDYRDEKNNLFQIASPQEKGFERRKAPSQSSSLASSAIEQTRSASVASYIRAGKGGRSVAGSIPTSIRSAATALENNALNKTLDSTDRQAKEWAAMVLRADQARIDQERAEGLTPFLFPDEDDHKSLLEAWQQADAVAEAGWKKKCSMQEEEKREEEMAATWEPETQRWEARARVKALETEQGIADQELQGILENKTALQTVYNLLSTTWQERKTKAEESLKQIKKELGEAEAKWDQLAKDKVGKNPAAQATLKDQDDAVLALFEKVMEEEGQEKEVEITRTKKARLRAEGEAYNETLITKRNNAVTPYLAAPANQEIEARELYLKATMEEALSAARAHIPRGEKAWETRISMANAAEKKAEQLAKDAPHETTLLTATRMKTMREIDEQALLAFQEESKRLKKIELIWERQIETEKKAPALDRLAAVRAFHLQENLVLWEKNLPSEERETYNDFITFANEVTHTSDAIALQETKEWAEELRSSANQLQKKFTVFSSTKKAARDAATEAEKALRELLLQADQRKVAIDWGKLTPLERERAKIAKINEWKNHVATAFALARKAKDERSWESARVAAMEAVGYWDGVVEKKSGANSLGYTQEEALLQRDGWKVKATLAEVKALAAKPCGDGWEAKRDRANERACQKVCVLVKT